MEFSGFGWRQIRKPDNSLGEYSTSDSLTPVRPSKSTCLQVSIGHKLSYSVVNECHLISSAFFLLRNTDNCFNNSRETTSGNSYKDFILKALLLSTYPIFSAKYDYALLGYNQRYKPLGNKWYINTYIHTATEWHICYKDMICKTGELKLIEQSLRGFVFHNWWWIFKS